MVHHKRNFGLSCSSVKPNDPPFKGLSFTCLFVIALILTSLTTLPAFAAFDATYTVRKGDNLSVIAKIYGVTVSQIKSTNRLNNNVIHVGQKLTLSKPFSRKDQPRVRWATPAKRLGKVLKPFGQYKTKGILMPQTGAEMACPVGAMISVPGDGVLRHIGPLDGFGTLVIIEHAGKYATVLAPLNPDTITAKVGDALRRGDSLGRTAQPFEDGAKPYLHVELRRNDKAIPPAPLLK